MLVRQFNNCEAWLWPEKEYVEVRFPDGTISCGAVEQGSEEKNAKYSLTAQRHGYNSSWQMCSENEQLHILMAEAQGLDHSPVLWKMAHGIKLDKGELYWEEKRVMALMKYLNNIYDHEVADICTWLAWSNIEPSVFRQNALAKLR